MTNSETQMTETEQTISGKDLYIKAFILMCRARAMAAIYEENRQITKYVHSTSKGHEAIQLATGFC